MTMQEAAEVVTKTCAYTNHTILAEALETWPLDYLEEVVPQLVPIIRYLDENVRARYTDLPFTLLTKTTVCIWHILIFIMVSV